MCGFNRQVKYSKVKVEISVGKERESGDFNRKAKRK